MKTYIFAIALASLELICSVYCNSIPSQNIVAENAVEQVSQEQSVESSALQQQQQQQQQHTNQQSLHISQDETAFTEVEQAGGNVDLGQTVTIDNFPEVEFNTNPSNAESLMAGVKTLDDFLSLLEVDGRPVNPENVFSEYDSESGKMVVAGGGRLAVPDDCSARNSTVRILSPPGDANVVYFPKCSTVERCGGCCQSPYLECVPDYTERVQMKVFKARWRGSGNPHLDFEGFAPIILDRHVRCRVKCTLTAERCGPHRDFLENVCDCRCKNYTPCNLPLVWDDELCMCKCQATSTCCDEGDWNCGLVFNEETCECDVDGRLDISGGRVNYTDEEIAEMAANAGNSVGNVLVGELPEEEEIVAETEPTTPATTTTTTPADPCASVRCPGVFIKVINSQGDCVCRPRVRMQPGRRPMGRRPTMGRRPRP